MVEAPASPLMSLEQLFGGAVATSEATSAT
jgi:hypothetical protein